MDTATFNIPIQLDSTGGYTISELKEKLMAYAVSLISSPRNDEDLRTICVSDRVKSLSAVPPTSSDVDYKDEITDVMSSKYRV